MKTTMYITAMLALVMGITSCAKDLSDDKTYRPPKGEPGMGVSFESPANRYRQGQKHPGQNNTWKIRENWADTVWLNDRIHNQIVVWTNDEEFDGLSYEVSDLTNGTNVISKSNINLRFCSYIIGDEAAGSCSAPNPRNECLIADALSTSPVTKVTAADPIKIWATINTPKTAVPGKYTGMIEVTSGETTHLLTIELLVVDRTLPDVKDWEFHLDLWQFPYALKSQCTPAVEMCSDQYFTLMEPIYRQLADAGQKAISTYIKGGAFYSKEETMVQWTRKSNGTWAFDYTLFDKFVSKMMDWGISKQISCFSLAGWDYSIYFHDEATNAPSVLKFVREGTDLTLPENADAEYLGSERYKTVWNAFLDSFKAHLSTKGWLSKTVLYMDEIPHGDMQAVIDVIKTHDSNWKIGLAGSSLSPEMEAEMYDYSIFLTRESQKTTAVKTFYTSCSHIFPNSYVSPDSSPMEMAWMGWHAAGNGYNGYLRWAYDNWRTGNPIDARDSGATAGDCHMVYFLNKTSDQNNVVPSTRCELLRQGIQDYEKIRILNNAELNAFAATVNAASASSASYYVAAGEALIAKVSAK